MRFRPAGRREGRPGSDPAGRHPGSRSPVGSPAPPIAGASLSGQPVTVDTSSGVTVVLFLTSSCRPCQAVWELLGEAGALPGRLAVVTPGPATESRRRVAAMAPAGPTVVMSDQTWLAYGPGPAPWSVTVEGGVVTSEGPAPRSRADLAGLLAG